MGVQNLPFAFDDRRSPLWNFHRIHRNWKSMRRDKRLH